MGTKLTILFAGMIAAQPNQGGATWAVLQYVLGLRQLGHEVLLVEPITRDAFRPGQCDLTDSTNAEYFRSVTSRFELYDAAALLEVGTQRTVGMPYEQLRDSARRADVLINVSGMLTDEQLISGIPCRVYLDLDPAFVQLWHAVQGIDMRFDAHNRFVTVGLAIGSPSCPIPTCGRDWITTLQPVVLGCWPRADEIRYPALTTIGNWRGYGSIDHGGTLYGQKAHSLRELITLPKHCPEEFLLAMSIHAEESTDLERLSANGWELIDPAFVAGDPWRYREFIRASKAEFGVAKSGYVHSRCGWFSDRSVCYLASGRPVIAQDTGFSDYLPIGEGLFAFNDVEDAVPCIDAMNRDYERHAAAARAIAEAHFDSNLVLPEMLRRVGVLQ